METIKANALNGTFGVATHFNYNDGQYADYNAAINDLKYLGIDHVRDAQPNPNFQGQGAIAAAANAGLKFTFTAGSLSPSDTVSQLHAFEQQHPGSIYAIEGPNEVNNFPVSYNGQAGVAGAQAYQSALYDAVKADPLLKDLPVLNYTNYPTTSGKSDWNNGHVYPSNGDQPGAIVAQAAAEMQSIGSGKPFAITEGGYHTSLTANGKGSSWEGVDEPTQAKLTLNMYMDAAANGSKSTDMYQLLDAYIDGSADGSDQEKHFGMFHTDGTAKPVAVALHNLTTILKDNGSQGFDVTNINVKATGLPSTGEMLTTQKSDGSHQVIAWAEPDIWDQNANTPIKAPETAVKFDFGQQYDTVQVFDPLKGADAVQTMHGVSSINVGVSDHPVVINLVGAGSPASASMASTPTPSAASPTNSPAATTNSTTNSTAPATGSPPAPSQAASNATADPTAGSTAPVNSSVAANGMSNTAAANPTTGSTVPSTSSGASVNTPGSPLANSTGSGGSLTVGSSAATISSTNPASGPSSTTPSVASAQTGTGNLSSAPAPSTISPTAVVSPPGASQSPSAATSGTSGANSLPGTGNRSAFQPYFASPQARAAALSAEKKVIQYASKHPETVGAANKILDILMHYW